VVARDGLGTEGLFGLAGGTLESEASLHVARHDQLCIDAIVRQWGPSDRRWVASFHVDGVRIDDQLWSGYACTPYSHDADERPDETFECLPRDAALSLRPSDRAHPMTVRGGRLCFEDHSLLTEASRSVTLSLAHGAYTIRFDWELE
jgi:hypothetical protein